MTDASLVASSAVAWVDLAQRPVEQALLQTLDLTQRASDDLEPTRRRERHDVRGDRVDGCGVTVVSDGPVRPETMTVLGSQGSGFGSLLVEDDELAEEDIGLAG
ncbi:MAG: hypothetical protein U0667_17540 [Chloroflexota bacterium]